MTIGKDDDDDDVDDGVNNGTNVFREFDEDVEHLLMMMGGKELVVWRISYI